MRLYGSALCYLHNTLESGSAPFWHVLECICCLMANVDKKSILVKLHEYQSFNCEVASH